MVGLAGMDSETTLKLIVIACFACMVVFGALGKYIASQSGRSEFEGLVLGVLFGPLGCLIEALLPKHR